MKCLFSLQDIVISVVFVLSLFAGAVSNADYSSANADNYDNSMCDNDNIKDDEQDLCDDFRTVRDAQGATAVSFSVMYNCTM